MQAAYPFIDDFLPAGTVASLERLGLILAGNSPGRSRGRPHRRASGHTLPRDLQTGASGPRRITPNPGAGKRLGAWATQSPAGASKSTASSRPVPVGSEADPTAPRPLA